VEKELVMAATKGRGIAPLTKTASKAHSAQVKARKAAQKASTGSGIKAK
jgi:hypothetical protein